MKIIIQFTFITFTIILLFKYNILNENNLKDILFLFMNKLIPSMFPIILITNYIKNNVLSKNNINKYIKYLCLLFSFAPSNAIISTSRKELLYSSVINPLYSYSILINFFSFKKTIAIIIINLLVHWILLYINIDNTNTYNIKNKSLVEVIKETTTSIINILGIIIFFNILLSLLSIFINKKYLFFMEISNGFNIISTFRNNIFKDAFLFFLNSFGGTAIFMQIKSINNDANYKLLFDKTLLSIFVTLISIMILK